MKPITTLLTAAAALALLVNQATAATFTWSGATSNNYVTTTNWVGGVAPTTNVTTNEVSFAGNTNVSGMIIGTAGTYYLKSLTFDATNTVDTRLVLAGAITGSANTRPLVFSSDTGTATLTVSGAGNKTIDRVARADDGGNNTMSLTSHLDVVHNGSGNLTLGNGENANTNWGIRIVGAGNINKSGAGTMILAGNNTYTGQTNINAGAVTIQRSASLGGTGGGTSVTATGASLRLDGTTFGALTVAGEALSLNGTGISGNGSLRNLGGANSWSGAVTLAGAATIQSDAGSLALSGGITNGGNTLTVQGAANTTVSTTGISGAGGLTKAGAGILTLSVANTYTGGTTVSAGTLEVNNTSGSGTGSGTVTVNGTLAGEGSITTAANNYVNLNGTLQVGSLGATQGTDFSLTTSGTGSIVLGGSSFTSFDLWNSPSGDQTGNLAAADMLRLFGDFSITSGASLVLNNPNSRSFMAGDVFKLFDWAGLGTLSGTYGSIDSSSLGLGSLLLDTSNLYTTTGALAGTIGIIAIPEPSRALLMMLGVFGVLTRRCRR